jgi:hypothetical protein
MRQQRCEVDLDELERQWREKPRESWMLQAQAKYDEFEVLPLIVLARLR